MNDILSSLSWRYATKKFDTTKKVSPEDFETLLEALRLTPSSFGLQPWKFVIVKNPSVREELVGHSWGQRQVADASHLLVLCRKTHIDSSLVENYIADMIQKTGAPAEALQ
jgi:nitroreductase